MSDRDDDLELAKQTVEGLRAENAALRAERDTIEQQAQVEARFTEGQIRAAFWDVFHESGEWWFGGERGDRDDNQRRTGIYWEQFIAALRARLTPETKP